MYDFAHFRERLAAPVPKFLEPSRRLMQRQIPPGRAFSCTAATLASILAELSVTCASASGSRPTPNRPNRVLNRSCGNWRLCGVRNGRVLDWASLGRGYCWPMNAERRKFEFDLRIRQGCGSGPSCPRGGVPLSSRPRRKQAATFQHGHELVGVHTYDLVHLPARPADLEFVRLACWPQSEVLAQVAL